MSVIKKNKEQEKKFNFWVPIDFSKSKVDENGDMIVEGIASDDSEDADGEFLDPIGFDFQPLLDTGVINWNHQAKKDPGAIIGEPITAHINKAGKFYIKGKLYKDDPLAQATYKKAQVLEKNSSTRRLGWSIEGIPLETDPINTKRIKRALITGAAITHVPKNANTFVSIVKGKYSEAYVEDETDETEDEKAMDTAAMAPTTLESVETDKRKILTKSDIYISIISNFRDVDLLKAKEIYAFIKTVEQQFYPDMSTQNNGGVNSQTLSKAYEILRAAATFEKSGDGAATTTQQNQNTNTSELEKGKGVNEFKADTSTADAEAVAKRKDELKKAATEYYEKSKDAGHDPYCEDMIKKGMSLSECQGSWQEVVSEMNAKNQGGTITTSTITKSKEDEEKEKLEKARQDEELKAKAQRDGQATQLQTSFEKGFADMNQLIHKQSQFIGEKFVALADINEGLQKDNEELRKSLEETIASNKALVDKLNSLPVSRKAATSPKAVERHFEKANANGSLRGQGKNGKAAGEEGETQEHADNAYNLASKEEREQLMDGIMAHPNYSKDAELRKAVSMIEISKSLDSIALKKIRSAGFDAYRDENEAAA